MQFTELIITIQLKEPVHFTKSQARLGHELHKLMLLDAELSVLHAEKGIKNYCFSNLYPAEPDGFYKPGKVYILRYRGQSSSMARALKLIMNAHRENSMFSILSSELKTQHQRLITSFTSITPTVATFIADGRDRCWTPSEKPLNVLMSQLQANLVKKLSYYLKSDVTTEKSFIQNVEMLSRKPLKIIYERKDRIFLGYKFKIVPEPDEMSQMLAFTALACGLGEKNSSLGCGFCLGGQYA